MHISGIKREFCMKDIVPDPCGCSFWMVWKTWAFIVIVQSHNSGYAQWLWRASLDEEQPNRWQNGQHYGSGTKCVMLDALFMHEICFKFLKIHIIRTYYEYSADFKDNIFFKCTIPLKKLSSKLTGCNPNIKCLIYR